VRGIGLCELPAAQLRAAHAVHPISVIEQEYSLFARDLEVCTLLPPFLYLHVLLRPPSLGPAHNHARVGGPHVQKL
jgi:hypothetical protein